MNRVSMARGAPFGPLSSEKVFMKTVPTGKPHLSDLLLSIFLPFGTTMKRCFSIPSLQSGGSGTYSCMLAGCFVRSGAAGKMPSSLMLLGILPSGSQKIDLGNAGVQSPDAAG